MFERVTILGPGLIGASMGLAIKLAGLAGRVVGVGRRQSSLAEAESVGAIDCSTLDPVEGVRGADFVVLATGVKACLDLGLMVMPHLEPGCLLTDVASSKEYLVSRLAAATRPDVSFVSSHPLAGSERKGANAARVAMFQGARCVLTPTGASREGDLERLRRFWEAVGARTCELDAAVHDALLAEASHLPHVAATCLVNAVSRDSLEFAATGFRGTTRVASGEPEIWKDICISNARALAESLRRYGAEVESFAAALEDQDERAVERRLAAAKRCRDQLIQGRLGTAD